MNYVSDARKGDYNFIPSEHLSPLFFEDYELLRGPFIRLDCFISSDLRWEVTHNTAWCFQSH